MNELLNYLYQPSLMVNSLLNASLIGILILIVIGFIQTRTKVTKRFFYTWLASLALFCCMIAYGMIEMQKELNSDALRQSVEISRKGNELIITGKNPIVKTTKLTIEDETDTNVYIKIGRQYIKLAKSEF